MWWASCSLFFRYHPQPLLPGGGECDVVGLGEEGGGDVAGFGVGLEVGVEGGGGGEGGALHGLADDVGHLRERAVVVAEGLVDDLVGGIDDAGHVAASVDGIEGELQAAELLGVGLQELQGMALEQVEARAVEVEALGE